MKVCEAEDKRKAAQLLKAVKSRKATEDVRKASNDPPAAYMDGSKYATIKIISSLIRYSDKRSTFWKTAERREELVSKWLKNSHFKTKVSVQSLKDHRSELMRALNFVHTHSIRGPERPYAIGREYFHLLEQRRTQTLTPDSTGPVT